MPAELSWTDNADAGTTSLPWTTVQRTSETSAIERRLWNELSVTGTASTAEAVIIRAGWQMNVGEPFLFSSVEPAEAAWMQGRQLSTVSNPLNGTSGDHGAYSAGWSGIGGKAVFQVRGAIPRRFARHFEFKVKIDNTGSATSVNAFQVVADYSSGLIQRPSLDDDIFGDYVVYQGDASQYRLVRAREGIGFQVKENPDGADADTVLVEPGFFQLGPDGMGETQRFEHTIPTIANDGDAVATIAGDEYIILVTKNPTGFKNGVSDFTFTKGSKSNGAGTATPPAAPTLNHIPVCYITKTHGSNIATGDIDNSVAEHAGATLTFDGSGLDAVVGPIEAVTSGIGHTAEKERPQSGLTNNSTLYVKYSPQGSITVDTTAPAANETFLGVITTLSGNTTAVSNRQPYHAVSAYRRRRKREIGPWIDPDTNDTVQYFGRLDRVASGEVSSGNSITVTFVAGHRVVLHVGAAWLITIGNYAAIDTETVILTLDGSALTTLTATATGAGANEFHGSGSGSNTATATDLAATINADLSGVTATSSGAVVTVVPDTPVSLSVALSDVVDMSADTFVAAGDARLTGTLFDGAGSETDPTTEDLTVHETDIITMSDNRWFGTGANDPDVTITDQNGLDCAMMAYRCEPWDNRGAPFIVASLRAEFTPTTNAAALQVRLYKVFGTGTALTDTVFNSTALSGMDGSGTGIVDIPCQVVLNDSGGTNCDTEKWWTVPDNAVIDPWRGEWIFAEVSGITDIANLRLTLDYYDLFD